MPKILQINSCVAIYSTGRIVEEIGNAIIEQDWESYIAYGRSARISNSYLIKIGSIFTNRIHGILTRIFDAQGLGSIISTLKFIHKIKKISPDIIHIHNIHDYYINYPIFFKFLKKANVPVVWTFHDLWPITGHCAHFSMIGCEKWKVECHHCPQKKEYPSSYFFDFSRQNYHFKKKYFNSIENLVIVPVSNWLAGILYQSFLSNLKINLIYNGIDLQIFKPSKKSKLIRKKYKIEDRFMLLGVASTWSKNKGLYDYFKLSKELNSDEVIVLVGLNQNQIINLPFNIIGLEKTEDLQSLVDLYNEADIVLNLSFEETFGLTTVEGMACGTPGIVYNCTASPELITPETGFVVEPGNIEGIIEAKNVIKRNGKAYYSKECIERVKKYYNKFSNYKNYIELYKNIIKTQTIN